MSIASLILGLFAGRQDYVAIPNPNGGFQPQQLSKPLPAKWLESEHLGGNRCFGFYLMDENSQVRCSAVDFDNKPSRPDPHWQRKAEQMYFALCQLGLSPLVEVSQSGTAAHVWLFFDEPVDAWLVRQFWAAAAKQASVPIVEVYPRQDALTGKGLGNLIRYPLFNLSRFVDVENEWQTLEAEATLASAKRTDATTLKTLTYQISGHTPSKPELGVSESGLPAKVHRLLLREHTLLSRRWRGDFEGLTDPSRSACCQSIACELVRLYVPTPEIEQTLRAWCEKENYEKGDRDEWIAATVAKAYDFIGGREAERISTSWTLEDAVHEYVDSLAGDADEWVTSGVDVLDNSVDGIAVGEMCVIAARPSHGKTAFALHWVDSAAKAGVPCLLVSEEMSRREIAKRALLRISEFDVSEWRTNRDELHVSIADHYAERSKVYGVESCQSIEEVERIVGQHCDLYGVKLVAVDYLQLLESKKGSRYESVTDISRRLKQLAMRHRVAMLCLCQLNREIEKRPGNRPQLSDLRESGQIEQDADTVLFLQWPFRMDAKEDPTEYQVWCAKRRNGPIRSPLVKTVFDSERQQFGGYRKHKEFEAFE